VRRGADKWFEAPEVAGLVDEPRGPELAAGDVEVAHGVGQEGVGDGHAVARHATREPGRRHTLACDTTTAS
jgi:hypothetical protein